MNYQELQNLETKIAIIIQPYFRTASLEPQIRRMQLNVMVTLIHRNAKTYSEIDILKEFLNTVELIKANRETKDIQMIFKNTLKVNTRQLENAIRNAKHTKSQHLDRSR